MYGNWWWGHMGGMWVSWILPVIVLVLSVRWLTVPTHGPETPRESAEEVLKKRYARGEVGKEEYESKLSDLRR
jgi:putative membrane protein